MCNVFHTGADNERSQKSWLVAAMRNRMTSASIPSC